MFVASRDAAPPPDDGTVVVVADTTWTPTAGERPDLVPLRPMVARIVETIDVSDDALKRLDEWAAAGDLATRSLSDGIAIWHQIREGAWSWLHERLLWAYIVSEVAGQETVVQIAPGVEEAALQDVVAARTAQGSTRAAPRDDRDPMSAATETRSASLARQPVPDGSRSRGLGRILRSLRPRSLPRSTPASGSTALADPVEAWLARTSENSGRGVLVLSYLRVAQVIGSGEAGRVVDPNVAPVIDRLAASGMEPIVLAFGGSTPQATAGASRTDSDVPVLPDRLLSTRWADPADPGQGPDARSDAADAVVAVMDAAPLTPLDVGGIDLGPALRDEVRRRARDAVVTNERVGARVGRMLDELRPAAMVLTHEGLRTAWLAAAAQRSIPTFAVQHGVIYPTHPGYRHARGRGLVLPTVTFVAGPYELRSLLEHGGYLDEEVVATGAPRLDLDAPSVGAVDPAEGDAVRRELGVAADDRLLVVSTVNVPFIQKTHYLHMLERILGAPLPGVHIVFKLHPGERDEGPYRALLLGIARAAGFDPPPISVVKDIDLYRLLRAADAHLGLFSTVLTDAVVAGTPNLFADVNSHVDPIGYVAAGVARPVRDAAEMLGALADPQPADPIHRQAFLDDHFRPGDASARIADKIATVVRSPEEAGKQ
jgi:hypothetical protein